MDRRGGRVLRPLKVPSIMEVGKEYVVEISFRTQDLFNLSSVKLCEVSFEKIIQFFKIYHIKGKFRNLVPPDGKLKINEKKSSFHLIFEVVPLQERRDLDFSIILRYGFPRCDEEKILGEKVTVIKKKIDTLIVELEYDKEKETLYIVYPQAGMYLPLKFTGELDESIRYATLEEMESEFTQEALSLEQAKSIGQNILTRMGLNKILREYTVETIKFIHRRGLEDLELAFLHFLHNGEGSLEGFIQNQHIITHDYLKPVEIEELDISKAAELPYKELEKIETLVIISHINATEEMKETLEKEKETWKKLYNENREKLSLTLIEVKKENGIVKAYEYKDNGLLEGEVNKKIYNIEEIYNYLLNRKINILQFSGHGKYSKETGENYLLINDKETPNENINTKILKEIHKGKTPYYEDARIAILAACHSGKTKQKAGRETPKGITTELMKMGFKTVIATPFKIETKTITEYTEKLLNKLIKEKKEVGKASQETKKEIINEKNYKNVLKITLYGDHKTKL